MARRRLTLEEPRMTTLLDHLDARPTHPHRRLDHPRPAAPRHHGRRPRLVHLAGHAEVPHPEQKAQAAEAFDAEGQFLSAGKKLIDTSHTAFRAVTAIRGKDRRLLEGADRCRSPSRASG